MGIVAIACYKPKKGRHNLLKRIIKGHSKILLREKLITDRPVILLATKNGIIMEIFEWKSDRSKVQAHRNATVIAHWNKIEANSKSVKLADVEESEDMYANFQPIN
ncbi:MAG: hypothetical protein ABSE00_07805 [Chitinispirillaceae bacterium]|jgi:hypothetical protein